MSKTRCICPKGNLYQSTIQLNQSQRKRVILTKMRNCGKTILRSQLITPLCKNI